MKNGVFWNVTPFGSCKNPVSEELSSFIIRVTKIGELGTTLAITSNRRTLRRNGETNKKEAQSSSETWVLTRATRRSIPEDTIIHCVL
jgi:hypothetical protein